MKNELGGSATQQELIGWGVGGHNGMDRGTGGSNPQPPVNSNPGYNVQRKLRVKILITPNSIE